MDIAESVLAALGGERAARLSGILGVEPALVREGLASVVPVLLGGALRLAGSGGAERLRALVAESVGAGNPLDRVDAILEDEAARQRLLADGGGAAQALLGDRSGAVETALASLLSLRPETVRQMAALAAPLVMGALARAEGGTPTADGLAGLLSGARDRIMALLPPGTAALLDPAAAPPAPPPSPPPVPPASRARAGAGPRWLPWVLAGAAAVALVFALRGGREEEPAAQVAQTAAPTVVAEPLLQTVALPGGIVIDLRQGGIVDMTRRYLATDDPPGRRFVFDDLAFDPATDRVSADSSRTIEGLAAVMRAYPAVRVRILGYTDDSGDPMANQAVSEARARAVRDALVAAGVEAARISAEGRGEAEPVAPNDSEENRARNRRVELEVVAK